MITLQPPVRPRAVCHSEVAALLAIAVREAPLLNLGHPAAGFGHPSVESWELSCWFKRVASFMEAVCRLASANGEVAPLLDATLDADGRSLAHWGLRRWRDGQWELDNLELDYRLRSHPDALLCALESFAALPNWRGAASRALAT